MCTMNLRPLSRRTGAVVLSLLLGVAALVPAFAQQLPAPLQTEAERLAALLPGRVGAALVHLESGRAVYLDAARSKSRSRCIF